MSETEIEKPIEIKKKQPKPKRPPLTDEQKEALKKRLQDGKLRKKQQRIAEALHKGIQETKAIQESKAIQEPEQKNQPDVKM